MKVLLLGNYRPDRQFSMIAFEEALNKYLPQVGVTPVLLGPQERMRKLGKGERSKKWLGYLDKLVLFPKEIRRQSANVDLIHITDQGNAVWVKHCHRVSNLVTCHDLLPLRASLGELEGWTIGRTGSMQHQMNLAGLKMADSVACVSNFTVEDFRRLAGRDDAILVENGLYREMSRMDRADALQLIAPHLESPETPFVFHVGGNQHYKNRPGVLAIYRELRKLKPDVPRLVMAGHALPEELRQVIRDDFPAGVVTEIVRPSDEEVRALYSLADAFIFPSLYEGYGLPILEAQACGCAVFTSNRQPLIDVCNGGGVLIDPSNPKEAAQVIANNWNGRAASIEKGSEVVKLRTPLGMAQKYAELYPKIKKK